MRQHEVDCPEMDYEVNYRKVMLVKGSAAVTFE